MKNILFIGGSTGIGFASIKKLQLDNNVFVASRTKENLSDLEITHIPFDLKGETFDISVLPEVIDGFVYCPGTINLKPFRSLKVENFQDDFEINFLGMIKIVQQILPKLLNSKHASVVLFSSVAAKNGLPFHTSIAASKGAIEGFAKAFAAEYAPKIRLNVIAPSLTETPLSEKLLNSDLKKEKSAERHPLKRIGQPEDISSMVNFILSDESSWVTGQVLNVDGGISTLNTN
ncbi:SDR family NAD(P)-dependent oxidoreductase [Flavobacterium qiangtangense]|uniref:SDR family NAD(P)-dependent oxidoreductase n=1 Tax=Flavobacterium qiangtangense TaxID=1442595 RepID=A0ABW1PI14_9FLAO